MPRPVAPPVSTTNNAPTTRPNASFISSLFGTNSTASCERSHRIFPSSHGFSLFALRRCEKFRSSTNFIIITFIDFKHFFNTFSRTSGFGRFGCHGLNIEHGRFFNGGFTACQACSSSGNLVIVSSLLFSFCFTVVCLLFFRAIYSLSLAFSISFHQHLQVPPPLLSLSLSHSLFLVKDKENSQSNLFRDQTSSLSIHCSFCSPLW